jgi:hypothetical protein
MSTKLLLGWSLLLAGCAPSALGPLVVDGQELHASLVTRDLKDVSCPARCYETIHTSRPTPSSSTPSLTARRRAGSAERVRTALYALYLGESELGLYGLEAASTADADRLEGALRGIWAYNESLGRARVHREGKVIVVVWNAGVSPSCWEAVNAEVVERLTAH